MPILPNFSPTVNRKTIGSNYSLAVRFAHAIVGRGYDRATHAMVLALSVIKKT
jgi:hypothetical protein